MKLDTGVERDELESLFASEADGVVQTGELFAHPLDDTRQDALLLLLEEGNLTAELHISLLVQVICWEGDKQSKGGQDLGSIDKVRLWELTPAFKIDFSNQEK